MASRVVLVRSRPFAASRYLASMAGLIGNNSRWACMLSAYTRALWSAPGRRRSFPREKRARSAFAHDCNASGSWSSLLCSSRVPSAVRRQDLMRTVGPIQANEGSIGRSSFHGITDTTASQRRRAYRQFLGFEGICGFVSWAAVCVPSDSLRVYVVRWPVDSRGGARGVSAHGAWDEKRQSGHRQSGELLTKPRLVAQAFQALGCARRG